MTDAETAAGEMNVSLAAERLALEEMATRLVRYCSRPLLPR